MAVLKLIVGLLTGSLGMLSDAAHSGIDLAGAVLTLLSVRVSDKPADEDHPYGHAKVENISAFIETFLMLASSVWITAEALIRIFIKPVALRYSVWPLLVLALSMAVDFWRSRQLRTVATRHQSDALAADAFHFASDIWASAAVFIGLCAAWTGSIFNIAWLRFADPIAAIVVSILILHFGWRLAWRTVAALTDSVAPETHRRVTRRATAYRRRSLHRSGADEARRQQILRRLHDIALTPPYLSANRRSRARSHQGGASRAARSRRRRPHRPPLYAR